MIKDSGNRREFETGAVRDIQEGKGRCDLLPIDVISVLLCDKSLDYIHKFTTDSKITWLVEALVVVGNDFGSVENMILEVSKHFEEGCKKYGEDNWKKGIPTNCYIDSAIRHRLKWLRGDHDEPHDRAFAWNLLCCIWTCVHKPELNVYSKENENRG